MRLSTARFMERIGSIFVNFASVAGPMRRSRPSDGAGPETKVPLAASQMLLV